MKWNGFGFTDTSDPVHEARRLDSKKYDFISFMIAEGSKGVVKKVQEYSRGTHALAEGNMNGVRRVHELQNLGHCPQKAEALL